MRNHHSSKSGFQEPLNKKARVDLPAVPEIARVRCQCLHLQGGLVRIIVVVCVRCSDRGSVLRLYAKSGGYDNTEVLQSKLDGV